MPACFYKIFLFFLLTLFFYSQAYGQHALDKRDPAVNISLATQLNCYSDISTLPLYLSNTTSAQVSTYDTTGGNNDGFNGTYSFVRRNADSSLVLFELNGAGVINRIWTPTPTDDTLDFYIDDSVQVAFSIKYADLFSNKRYPFINPLCGNELGGYYCYLPIPFQQYCKIVCRAKQVQFHQVQYRLYPPGTPVKKFALPLNDEENIALKKIAPLWGNDKFDAKYFFNEKDIVTSSKAIVMAPGETVAIFNIARGGRILEIGFDNAIAFEGLEKNLDIKITWDGEPVAAVYCPIADFFGYAFGKTSMQSLLLGSRQNNNYCYFPMPFDKAARIELIYRKTTGAGNKPIRINATIRYSRQKRDAATEGKFYTCWNSNQLSANDPQHIFLQTKGKGSYIGSMLLAQGMRPGMTYFFEGDDSTATDNVFRMHGTGSEDYFNGGWYAFPDRWSRKLSLPLHGALDYSLPFCRTGAYRFYMADKISFEKNIYQGIEHGPENNIPVNYTSLAFYYCSTPPAHILRPTNALSAVYIPDTLTMYPQLMNFNVWENIACKANWKYNTGGQSFTFFATNESRLKISLDEIPDGRYQLFADLTNNEKGCSISLWQGQQQLADWISTAKQGQEERMPMQLIGEINIREFYRSLTVQFKTNGAAENLILSRLIFIKKGN